MNSAEKYQNLKAILNVANIVVVALPQITNYIAAEYLMRIC
jgi:hypothetical protein